MNDDDYDGPSAWDWISGIISILFGLFTTLIGGGCTIFWVGNFLQQMGQGMNIGDPMGLVFGAISVMTLVGGISAIRAGLVQIGIIARRP